MPLGLAFFASYSRLWRGQHHGEMLRKTCGAEGWFDNQSNGLPFCGLAAQLSEQHSSAHGTRSLDIVHVATAKLSRIEEFVSFDSRQRGLASAIGLQVSP